MLTTIERDVRHAGAEEILLDVAEDLDRDPRFRRAEGGFDFGDRYALRVSVAYKGNWVRYGRSYEKSDANSSHVAEVEDAIRMAMPLLNDGSDLDAWSKKSTMAMSDVVPEGVSAGTPLVALDQPAPGSIASIGMTLSNSRGCWLVSEPVLLSSEAGTPARSLAV